MVAFPIAKLAALAVKQISKPLVTVIKKRAKSHPLFRNYICMPPAQLYHWADVTIRMRIMGLGSAKDVQRLNEEMATELGAELLGEFLIFAIAAVTLFVEYQRSSLKDQRKEEERIQQLQNIENRIKELSIITEEHDAKLRRICLKLDVRGK